jgi:hypothetical protein
MIVYSSRFVFFYKKKKKKTHTHTHTNKKHRINAEVMGQYGGNPELVKLWSLLYISTSACLDALCAEATRMAADKSEAGPAAGERYCNRQMLCMERLRPWREGPLGQVRVVCRAVLWLIDGLMAGWLARWMGDLLHRSRRLID